MKRPSSEGAPSVDEYYRSEQNKEAIQGVLRDPITRKLVEQEMAPEELLLALKYLKREDSSEEGSQQLTRLIFTTYKILESGDMKGEAPKRVMGQSAKKPEQK